ncbi:hypothetical protein [Gluconobacter cerinus]|uniref:hypothetical protein n=1 Tax=Gluconobacter cerinus TaxID=38307 RepID=UPI001B8CB508|nr:hypothetical protein [Gluconobacter cerinus]MBS0995833.1 hypothetical protein [Gluconobacter cerinus]
MAAPTRTPKANEAITARTSVRKYSSIGHVPFDDRVKQLFDVLEICIRGLLSTDNRLDHLFHPELTRFVGPIFPLKDVNPAIMSVVPQPHNHHPGHDDYPHKNEDNRQPGWKNYARSHWGCGTHQLAAAGAGTAVMSVS